MRDEEELTRVIADAHREGWQVAVHAVGDRAISHIVTAFEKAQSAVLRHDPRHRVEHFTCPPPQGLARMKEVGALVVVQPSFLPRMRRSIHLAFGPRAHTYYPGRSVIDAGVHYVGSSDAPTGDVSPWRSIAAAVDRGAADGDPIGVSEAVTSREAIGSYVHGGAYAMKQESWRGRLAPGMAADLVALDRDPFAEPAPRIGDTKPLMTMVRGQIHHDLLSQHARRITA